MGATARFTIDGTPSTDRGYDIVDLGTPVSCFLETPHADVTKFQIRLVAASKAMATPAPVYVPVSGVATTPTGSIDIDFDLTTEDAAVAYLFEGVINNGQDASGAEVDDYRFRRIIVARSPKLRLRPKMNAERSEYDPIYGTTSADEEIIAALEELHNYPSIALSSATETILANQFGRAGLRVFLSGAAATVNLPPALDWIGKALVFKKIGVAGAVVIDPDGAEKIDDLPTFSLTGTHGSTLLRAEAAATIYTMPR